jgi:plastocyanin
VKPAPVVVASLLAAVLGLTACADDQPQSAPGSPGQLVEQGASGRQVQVLSIDNVFNPGRIEVAPGTEVVFVNLGKNDHDIRSNDGWGIEASNFKPGDTYRRVFDEPGEYRYFCHIHGTEDIGMIGTVVVVDQ